MNALSFLGTGRYEPTTYVWVDAAGEHTYETHLFPEAVARLFEPERLVLFVTPQARAGEHFRVLQERLQEKIYPVEIPEGGSREDLWQIFEACAGAVAEGEEILLDVTHAFRSLPLIVFTVAAYLRRAKNVTVNRLIYGAYEARDDRNRSPIFDLTPLLDLLDWLNGAEAFLRRSDAAVLAGRLEDTQRRLWRERAGEALPRKLQVVAGALRRLSLGLHHSRPLEVMREAERLLPLLDEVAAESRRWAKPFAVVLERVRAEVAVLAHPRPGLLDEENLAGQITLIEHYLGRNLVVQAVTLAREWLISWAVLRRGGGDWLAPKVRKRAEDDLGQAAAVRRGEAAELPAWLADLPQGDDAVSLWMELADLRNDLAHCGMRPSPRPAASVEDQARVIPARLRSLLAGGPSPAVWGGRVTIDLKELYGETARLEDLPLYLARAKELAGEGNEVVLTGQAPIWLYLAVAHALHGKARKLLYSSPVTGEVLVFDHTST